MAKVKLGNVKGSKGDKGDRGSLWRVTDKMTGQSTSGTAFPGAGFEDSVVNDICLNPTTFDLYRCQTAGNAAAAKWVWECNIKGATGPKGDKGDPTTVDAVLSESSANPIQNKTVATKFKDVQDSLDRSTIADTIRTIAYWGQQDNFGITFYFPGGRMGIIQVTNGQLSSRVQ